MSKDNEVLEKMMRHSSIRSLGLKQETIQNILKLYSDIAMNTLLENGQLEVGNGLIIEVVQLLDRVHVLRGTAYKSSRKYKLKLTMEDKVYEKISSYYEKLREEII